MKNHDYMREAAIALEAVMRFPKKVPAKSRSPKPATGGANDVIDVRDDTRSEQIDQRASN